MTSSPRDSSLYPERLFMRFLNAEVEFTCDSVSMMRALERHFRPILALQPGDAVEGRDQLRTEALRHGVWCIVDTPADKLIGVESDDPEFIFWQLKDEIVLRLMRHTPDLAWIHAGGVELQRPDGGSAALLVVGPPGAGKSTLSSIFVQSGGRYLADDLLPIDLQGGGIAHPFPLSAHVRLPSEDYLPPDRVSYLKKTYHEFAPSQIASGPVPIAGIVISSFEHGAAPTLTDISPSMAVVTLADQCHNFPDYSFDAFADLCRMVERVPVARLVHGGAVEAEGIVRDWASARLAESAQAAASS